ncbi:2OG-Fe(II) oxygenase [Acidimangrovimonas pyrenivorans]|uniref:2OG-Fe(II) oxygenase n=1 Tax=Acidimangrovimonas pyrenivorans TaxID=2030798 RepID=A0ABV7ABT1_9RHOB
MFAIHTIPDAFTPAECARIVALAHQDDLAEAGLVGRVSDHNIRRAELAWLDERAGSDWVMERIIRLVSAVNRAAFGFDLSEFAESPQVARYGAEREGHFGWHSDIGDGPVARKRKLTMVVQLSAADAYDGGVLELRPDLAVRAAERWQGAAVLFPSFMLHRVTPVTRGERHSLTIWAHGPAFR